MRLSRDTFYSKFILSKEIFKSKIFIILLLISFVVSGALIYVKQSIYNWCESQKLNISISSASVSWHQWGIPGVSFEKVSIKNNDPKGAFERLYLDKISIQPYFFGFFQNNLKGYKLSVPIKNFKIYLPNNTILESCLLETDINYKHGIYEISNFSTEPVHVKKVSKKDSQQKGQKMENLHLVINKVKGSSKYFPEQSKLSLFFHIPPNSSQGPDCKIYSLQAKGDIYFLPSLKKYKDDPAVRGKITFTVQHFSNFLTHLYHAKIASKFMLVLGSAIGYPISKEDLFSGQPERFTNAVSVDMTFSSHGIYLGPVKL